MQKKSLKTLKSSGPEELFALSHGLLDVAKVLSQYHAAELTKGLEHTKEVLELAARSNLKEIEQAQKRAAAQAAQRMHAYHRNAKLLLKKLSNNSTEITEKYIDKAHESLLNWLDEADRKMPVGADRLSKVVRDISSVGTKAFKAGHKLANNVADNLDQLIDKTTGKDPVVKKNAPKNSSTRKTDTGAAEVNPSMVSKK